MYPSWFRSSIAKNLSPIIPGSCEYYTKTINLLYESSKFEMKIGVKNYSQDGNFIDSLHLVIRPLLNVFVDVFEVGQSHIPFERVILQKHIICELNAVSHIAYGAYPVDGLWLC